MLGHQNVGLALVFPSCPAGASAHASLPVSPVRPMSSCQATRDTHCHSGWRRRGSDSFSHRVLARGTQGQGVSAPVVQRLSGAVPPQALRMLCWTVCGHRGRTRGPPRLSGLEDVPWV